MKLTYTTASGRIIFEGEAQGVKAAFDILATLQELFEEPDCGCCKSKAIAANRRDIDNGCYYSWRCLDCGAQLDIGQKKDGKGMWAKRQDHPETRGWYVWSGREDRDEGCRQPSTPQRKPVGQPNLEESPF